MALAKFGVGQAVTRVEDQRLLTGGGRYTDDLREIAAASMFVLRSPHANARIDWIDTAAAAVAPGVLAVLTGADVAADGLGPIPTLQQVENRDGSPQAAAPKPILAEGQVRHVGDPVAVVVAETLDQARDAAELVEVDFQDLPAVTDTRAAARDGAPQVWEHIPNNVYFDWEMSDRAAVEAAFAAAAHVSRVELINNRLVANFMEPRAALADYDAASDRSTLYTPTQGPHIIHGQLAEMVLKIGTAKLRCVTTDVGGGFGTKAFLYPEQCLAVWASRRLQRAVRWTAERGEGFLSDVQARDHVTTAELALDGEGRFLAARVETYANLGAYLSNFGPFVPTTNSALLAGLYRIPAIHVNVIGVATNTVPVDAYRGAGRPEAAYVIERLADVAARDLGMTQDEIRRRNLIAADELPYTTAFGDTYDSGDFVAVMETCMARADWAGFEPRRAAAKARGRLRGIGMTTYVERCGGGMPETAILEFGEDGKLTAVLGTQDGGQGHQTAFRQVIGDALGVAAEEIEIVQGDTDRTPMGLTGGSRSLPVGGAAVLGAAEEVIAKGREVAGAMLETASVDIEFADGRFTVVGTDRSAGLFEVARAAADPANLPEGAAPGLDAAYTRTPEAATYPNGCHIVEIEVDPETGVTEILRYTVVDDFGAVINPLLLAGQVHGGIVQGLGQALFEHTVYDSDTGQLLAGSFMDYAMPRAGDVPSFDIALHNVPCTTNPLGIKGAGEAGSVAAPPALIAALVDALHPVTGCKHFDMPALPHRVWQAMQDGGAI